MRYFMMSCLIFVGCDGGGGGGIDPGPEPAASQFPAPSNVKCAEHAEAGISDAGEGGDAMTLTFDASDPCAPPTSVCANTGWLVYYDNGRCVAGTCTWDTLFQSCNHGCYTDGCRNIFTASTEPHLNAP
jgi:hypothetical protein